MGHRADPRWVDDLAREVHTQDPFNLAQQPSWPAASGSLSANLTAEFSGSPAACELFSPEAVVAAIDSRARELREIAQNPLMLQDFQTANGVNTLVVQHEASGMRVRFTELQNGEGVISAKPYKIPSISGKTIDAADTEPYRGLGIGYRIYLHAAQVWPHVRWGPSTPTTAYAHQLRAKVHAKDPYRFYDQNCVWCNQRNVQWAGANQQAFTGHP